MPFSLRATLKVLEQLLDAALGRGVPFDLALPAAGYGVVDELLLDGEAGAQPGCDQGLLRI